MREKYESLSLAVLRDLAKARNIPKISALRKKELIEVMLKQDEIDAGLAARKEAQESQERKAALAREAAAREASAQQDPETLQQGLTQQDTENLQRGYAQRTVENEQRGLTQRDAENAQNTRGRREAGGRSAAQRRQPRTNVPAGRRNMTRAEQAESARNAGKERRDEAPAGAETAAENERYTGQGNKAQTADQSQGEQLRQTREPVQGEQVRPVKESDQGEQARQAHEAVQGEQAREPVQSEIARQIREPAQGEQPRQTKQAKDLASIDSGNKVTGILEVMQDGFGFLRGDNYLSSENDVYVAPSQIRKFNLRTGDIITGNTRIKTSQEKYSALLYIQSVNGFAPAEAVKRYNFDNMTPIFPDQRLRMERGPKEVAMRLVDLLSPIGKGQRGMIVSPPKAGKTTLLKAMAKSILENEPKMHIIIMLIDERPEEVTDIREAIVGDNVEVLYSTFDELPDHHRRVAEMGIERAKRLVEHGQDVTILLDSITRLARAYNLIVAPSGRTLSGGLDPAALHMPKRFFGAARNMREGGSLTILATALVDTGSKMDDVVYEEFKGTGNMELVLDRKLSERRVFPAIDIVKSGTRREDLLLDSAEQEAAYIMRKALNGMRSDEAVENIINMFVHTADNEELVQRVRRQRFI